MLLIRNRLFTVLLEKKRKLWALSGFYLSGRRQGHCHGVISGYLRMSAQRKTGREPGVIPVSSLNMAAWGKLPVLMFWKVIMSFLVHGKGKKVTVEFSPLRTKETHCPAPRVVDRKIFPFSNVAIKLGHCLFNYLLPELCCFPPTFNGIIAYHGALISNYVLWPFLNVNWRLWSQTGHSFHQATSLQLIS